MELLPSHVWDFLRDKIALKDDLVVVNEAKSAQQTVLIVTIATSSTTVTIHDDLEHDAWRLALDRGMNKLVVRLWNGSARWWNLHQNSESGLDGIARAEIAGYRLARLALSHKRQPYIPQLLHWATSYQGHRPWAIFEYVGEDSGLFQEDLYDESWLHSMVQHRNEFGYDEPHPRWGRVPTAAALDYALDVLHQVVLPIHLYCRDSSLQTQDENKGLYLEGSMETGYTMPAMIALYKLATTQLQKVIHSDASMKLAINMLEKAIRKLEEESQAIQTLAPVLVHMDLQPQNLLFARTPNSKSRDDNKLCISSVLDWEEAALADPRFELLMLGRKICANRQQANIIWKTYSEHSDLSKSQLGAIEPWLRLETIHSLTTLILQSMNLLGGGRSPWEDKPQLLLKIKNEFGRLHASGWDFCHPSQLQDI
jgi:hypothetical protein